MLQELTTLLGSRELAVQVLTIVADGPSEGVIQAISDHGVHYWGNCPTCNGSIGLWQEVFQRELARRVEG